MALQLIQYEFDIVHRWQSDLRNHFASIVSKEDYIEENILRLFEVGLTLSEDWLSKALSLFMVFKSSFKNIG